MDRPTVDVAIVPDPGDSGPLPPTDQDHLSRVGRYIVLDVIGIGGMGTVHTAYDPKLDRKVALKILHDKGQRSVTGRARMLREAQALARLNHPNIVTVHDVDVFAGRLYIAMEYVDGIALDDWLDEADHGWREIIASFVEAGHGLAAAHEAGITHRDFKPGNVVIGTDGRIRVLDFGLAKTSESQDEGDVDPLGDPLGDPMGDPLGDPMGESIPSADSGVEELAGVADKKLTQVGRSVGTPAFMSPEQLFGLPVGSATDQFAFAVALFEALYGRLPFADEDDPDFLVKVSDGVVREVDQGAVPSWVHRALLRALRPSPGDRYASLGELLAALTDDPARRRRRVVLSAGLVTLSGLAVFGVVQGVRTDEAPCSGATERVEEVWGSARQEAVEQAFDATKAPFAEHAWGQVQTALDAYTNAWSEHHVAICEATNKRREQSPALMDVRMACLDRAHAQAAALIGELEQADAKLVSRAVAAVQSLPDVAPCKTEQPGGTAELPRAVAAEVRKLEAELASVRGVATAGRYDRALARSEVLVASAEQLGVPQVLAEALRVRADAFSKVNEHDEAVPLFTRAISEARRAGRVETEVSAYSGLIYAEGYGREHVDQALAYDVPAQAALDLLASDDGADVRAQLELAQGGVLLLAGRYEGAERALRSAIDHDGGRATVAVANAKINLSIALDHLGRRDEAIEELRSAAATIDEQLGDRHPRAATVALNLGNMLNLSQRYDEATLQYERSLAINRAVLGPEHPSIVKALIGLASIAKTTHDLPRARTYATEALEVLEAQPRPAKTQVAGVKNMLGRIDQAEADAAGTEAQRNARRNAALAHHEHAMEAYVAVFGTRPNLRVLRTHGELCHVLRTLGRNELARAHCLDALGIRATLEGGLDAADARVLTDLALLDDDPIARRVMLWAAYQWREAAGSLMDDDELVLAMADVWWADGATRRAIAAATALRDGGTTEGARARARQWLAAHAP